jgi:nucleoside 2-deoxyribosyltransferase
MSEQPYSVFLAPLTERYHVLENVITEALSGNGISVFSLEDITAGEDISSSISRTIQRADFVIADITESNPNVMYEVGYAHGLRKPVILIANFNAKENIPIGLKGLQFVGYDLARLEVLRDYLSLWLERYQKVEVQ